MTTEQQLAALKQVRLSITDNEHDVWRDDIIHVEGLHEEVWRAALDELDALRAGRPYGNIVLQGRAGLGKTHFLGRLRRHVMKQKDFFTYAQVTNPHSIWASLAYTLPQSLARAFESQAQASVLAQSLRTALDMPAISTSAASADEAATALEAMRRILRVELRARIPGSADVKSAVDVATALCMIESDHLDAREIGEEYIKRGALDPENLSEYAHPLAALGKRLRETTDRERVVALADVVSAAGGRLVVALDQFDTLLQSQKTKNQTRNDVDLHALANSLMTCAEGMPNSLIVLSCLEESWDYIYDNVVASAADRFPNKLELREFPSPAIAAEFAAAYLAPCYEKIGFTPPWPTWPVQESAFSDAGDYSPRDLLKALGDHIKACLRDGEARVMTALTSAAEAAPVQPEPEAPIGDADAFAALDAQFKALKTSADPAAAMNSKVVDQAAARPMLAGLRAWVVENQASDGRFHAKGDSSAKPALHGRLIEVIDADVEHEKRWSFRLITQDSRGGAALKRLQDAAEESGLNLNAAGRRLFILRPEDKVWSGAKTLQAVDAFQAKGGRLLTLDPDDIAVFQALEAMLNEHGDALSAWLRLRRPASGSAMFLQALADVAAPVEAQSERAPEPSPPEPSPELEPDPTPAPEPESEAPQAPILKPVETARPSLALGISRSGAPAAVDLEILRRHMVVFGASGSGKTMLLRRIIEECALHGASSIVLDPGGDLPRLGQPWPTRPESWTDEDTAKAARYHETVETVVWTPGLRGGQPLSFQPLAGLAKLTEDPDEFRAARDGVVAELAPKVKLPRGAKEEQGKAVLNQALAAYAHQGGADLGEFLDFLSDLPEDVCRLDDAAVLASKMANTLRAAQINDPLFGGDGQAADPGMLLTPSPGKAARVSVISLNWLPDESQRQTFASQLQRALFAWIKANPAQGRPLNGILVMDEAKLFAPAGATTPSLHATQVLAAQARKYGLGLVLATQAPKDLHNSIPGNAATHLYGHLKASAQINAAKEIAREAGAQNIPNFGQLTAGNFFLVSNGLTSQRIRTPFCLSWHPPQPLTPSEIQALATPQTPAPSIQQRPKAPKRQPRSLFTLPRFSQK